jgi:hypothetical protein
MVKRRAVIGRYCSILSRRPRRANTCLSLTSRAVSSKATETPFTSRAPATCPDICGGPGRRPAITILIRPPQHPDGHAATRSYNTGHTDETTGHTDGRELALRASERRTMIPRRHATN